MKRIVLNCDLRRDGQWQVIVAETSAGKGMRVVVSDRPVTVGTDVETDGSRVIHDGGRD